MLLLLILLLGAVCMRSTTNTTTSPIVNTYSDFKHFLTDIADGARSESIPRPFSIWAVPVDAGWTGASDNDLRLRVSKRRQSRTRSPHTCWKEGWRWMWQATVSAKRISLAGGALSQSFSKLCVSRLLLWCYCCVVHNAGEPDSSPARSTNILCSAVYIAITGAERSTSVVHTFEPNNNKLSSSNILLSFLIGVFELGNN